MTDDRPSKTQRKKTMLALQDLGAELVALNEAQLATISLPERLHEAVNAARRMTSFEARRRQLQYIGKLMRAMDPEPIRARLDIWKAPSREHTARLRQLEHWRGRLIDEETALAEFVSAYPRADAQRLRTLVRNTRHERATDAPPRSYRALFRLLRDTLERKEEDTDLEREE
ncbi:MAG: DUF615 domain-containing protein [Betaproteobacteria bacterium]|nr:DUF615 domain-containing protein [Betaproteobacteria bacterium]